MGLNVDDGMQGGPDPGGVPGGGPDVRTGYYDYDKDGDPGDDYAGSPGLGGDVETGMCDDGTEGAPDPCGSVGGQPRPEDFL